MRLIYAINIVKRDRVPGPDAGHGVGRLADDLEHSAARLLVPGERGAVR